MYVYQNFSKKDKTILREMLAMGVQREINAFLKESFPIHKELIEQSIKDIREPYWELANKFQDFSKYIQRKYDNYQHSQIPLILAELLLDNHITQNDIEDFSESGLKKLNEMVVDLSNMRD